MLLTSCIVYHPQTSDIPLIHKRNDLRLDAGISIVPSAHATISYGLADKVSIQTFGSIGPDERYYLQVAFGYFKEFKTNNVFEVYGGVGLGYGDAYESTTGGGLYGAYKIAFTQFNYGKLDCKFANMDYGIGLKTGLLNSNLIDNDYYYPADGIKSKYIDNSFLIEPNAFLRIGGQKLKFSIKLGGSWMYKFTNKNKSLPYSFINLGLGLNYRL